MKKYIYEQYYRLRTYGLGILSIILGVVIYFSRDNIFDSSSYYEQILSKIFTMIGKTGLSLIHIIFGVVIIFLSYRKKGKAKL